MCRKPAPGRDHRTAPARRETQPTAARTPSSTSHSSLTPSTPSTPATSLSGHSRVSSSWSARATAGRPPGNLRRKLSQDVRPPKTRLIPRVLTVTTCAHAPQPTPLARPARTARRVTAFAAATRADPALQDLPSSEHADHIGPPSEELDTEPLHMFRTRNKAGGSTEKDHEPRLYGSWRGLRSLSRAQSPTKRRSRSADAVDRSSMETPIPHGHPRHSSAQDPSSSSVYTRAHSRPLSAATATSDRTARQSALPPAGSALDTIAMALGSERTSPASSDDHEQPQAAQRKKRTTLFGISIPGRRKSSFSPAPTSPRPTAPAEPLPSRRTAEMTGATSPPPRTNGHHNGNGNGSAHGEEPRRARKIPITSKLDFWLHPRFFHSSNGSSSHQGPVMQSTSAISIDISHPATPLPARDPRRTSASRPALPADLFPANGNGAHPVAGLPVTEEVLEHAEPRVPVLNIIQPTPPRPSRTPGEPDRGRSPLAKKEGARSRSPLARLASPNLFRRGSSGSQARVKTDRVGSPQLYAGKGRENERVPPASPPATSPLATDKGKARARSTSQVQLGAGVSPSTSMRNVRHESFDFERPTSSGSGSAVAAAAAADGRTKVRFADGRRPRKAPESDSGVSVGSDASGPSSVGHRGVPGAPVRSHSKRSAAGMSLDAAGYRPGANGATIARPYGLAASWGHSTRERGAGLGGGVSPSHALPAFSFERAAPVTAPAGTAARNVSPHSGSGSLGGESGHERRRGKGRSLDLGLGLSWAPSRVKQEAVLTFGRGERVGKGKWGLDSRLSEVLEATDLAELAGRGREGMLAVFRDVLGDASFSTFKRYLRRYDAAAIPFDGPSGLLMHVDRLLDYAPGLDAQRKRRLLEDFARVVRPRAT